MRDVYAVCDVQYNVRFGVHVIHVMYNRRRTSKVCIQRLELTSHTRFGTEPTNQFVES